MKDNSYLFGEDEEVPEIPQDIIARRIELLNDNLNTLLDIHYLERDNERIHDILNAITFWNKINSK